MNILVTGTPGSGKTTLVTHANSAGNKRFFDADEIPALCEWRILATGESVGLVDEVKAQGGDTWYKTHGWYWQVDALKDFLTAHPNSILCGSAENVTDCYHF